jgi:hypothetical protein
VSQQKYYTSNKEVVTGTNVAYRDHRDQALPQFCPLNPTLGPRLLVDRRNPSAYVCPLALGLRFEVSSAGFLANFDWILRELPAESSHYVR